MATLTLEDLVVQAIEEGKIIQGINDPETLKDLEKADQSIAEGRTCTHEQVRDLIGRLASFRPSEDIQDHVEILMERARDGTITESEQAELDYFVEFEHLLRLVKRRAAEPSKLPESLPPRSSVDR